MSAQQQWEYRELWLGEREDDRGRVNKLNTCGRNGWEVVAGAVSRDTGMTIYLMRRPITETPTSSRKPKAPTATQRVVEVASRTPAKRVTTT